jgi:hypothetical protein
MIPRTLNRNRRMIRGSANVCVLLVMDKLFMTSLENFWTCRFALVGLARLTYNRRLPGRAACREKSISLAVA